MLFSMLINSMWCSVMWWETNSLYTLSRKRDQNV